ncbi:hypothetical protein PGTUg99_015836 [Puccinia graminis f. sp. tritici]|uniref:Uncharacterized protein n=1 Tax=Puccinia graminis f. sp. tritici TaxID=56615 RepID=A0A5B0RA59_PUCGR|nr:hypothetical protein PGTUg99_015836 [Puccinia graminis f. sp. tritici]
MRFALHFYYIDKNSSPSVNVSSLLNSHKLPAKRFCICSSRPRGYWSLLTPLQVDAPSQVHNFLWAFIGVGVRGLRVTPPRTPHRTRYSVCSQDVCMNIYSPFGQSCVVDHNPSAQNFSKP